MDELLIDTKDGVRTLTLNRPERLNAINNVLSSHLEHALIQATSDDEVRVVVITGSGRGFCTGLDLADQATRSVNRTRHEQLDDLAWVGRLILGIVHCDKPVIAAINGIAAGAGFALSLSCDLRFMSENARVTTGYIRRGLSPDAGMSYFLPHLIGGTRATELILTGRDMDSTEAERIGLVNQVFSDEEFRERVYQFARELASGPPIAMTFSKRLLGASPNCDLTTMLKQELSLIKVCFGTKDVKEGLRAFTEKRKPVFTGE
jgi:2-(1,2-epoxy-1,2-dihydrophenyl)acetyl-CoA isomerase